MSYIVREHKILLVTRHFDVRLVYTTDQRPFWKFGVTKRLPFGLDRVLDLLENFASVERWKPQEKFIPFQRRVEQITPQVIIQLRELAQHAYGQAGGDEITAAVVQFAQTTQAVKDGIAYDREITVNTTISLVA